MKPWFCRRYSVYIYRSTAAAVARLSEIDAKGTREHTSCSRHSSVGAVTRASQSTTTEFHQTSISCEQRERRYHRGLLVVCRAWRYRMSWHTQHVVPHTIAHPQKRFSPEKTMTNKRCQLNKQMVNRGGAGKSAAQ